MLYQIIAQSHSSATCRNYSNRLSSSSSLIMSTITSPLTNLAFAKGTTRIVQKLSGAIETGQYAFSCFYDLSKAFDRVWHAGLLCKLDHLGVRGKALDWLKDYRTTREQQVRVNGTPSSRLKIPATAIWAAYKVYWAGDVTGMGVSSLFRSPATLDRDNSVSVAPTNFLFYYKKPEVEGFRSRGRLSKSSKNWPRHENFCVIVSEVGWLSLKWYGGENVYNRDRQRPASLANTDRSRALRNWKKAK